MCSKTKTILCIKSLYIYIICIDFHSIDTIQIMQDHCGYRLILEKCSDAPSVELNGDRSFWQKRCFQCDLATGEILREGLQYTEGKLNRNDIQIRAGFGRPRPKEKHNSQETGLFYIHIQIDVVLVSYVFFLNILQKFSN